jgi:diguanylate cyclase (GGDEF)-like protein
MLDVDHFKRFNDMYGHRTGDEVLQSVGKCLPEAVRNSDFAARYGGEEFAVILSNVDRITAARICVKIRRAIETMNVEFEGQHHRVTVSVGAALIPAAGHPFSAKLLLETADRLLYLSKQKGRNCCSMHQLRTAPQPEAVAT